MFQLWTNEKSREFIAAEYPWFLDTFDGYTYPIQRADSIRYFVLAHYGGTYIDLDDVGNSPINSARNAVANTILNRAATADWTLFLHTLPGFAAPFLLVSLMTPWDLSHITHSFSGSLSCCNSTTVAGCFPTSRSCTRLARCSCRSFGRSTCRINPVRLGVCAY